MKRITFLLVVLLTMGSCISDPLPVANIPSVSLGENGKGYRDDNTGEEGELMRTSVRLYGFSEVNSSSILYERGFFVGNSVEDIQNGTASTYVVSSNDGAFSQDITGLDIDHTYYFCAFLKEGRKVAKSTINSFHTKAEGFALVNEITRKDDTVAARVSDNGGCEIKRVGFCYSLKESPDIFDNVILTELDEDGGFSAELSALKPSKTYFFRAFADNGVSGNRISYSEVLSITSEPSFLEVAQDSYLVDSEGGELVLSVSHNYPIEISIDVDWIQETATRATTLEDLRFQVLPSAETEERIGGISLFYLGSPAERTITITQKAGAFIIDFPDANFKAYCVESFDQNGDGEISNLEALEVQSIDVRTEHIETLRGIEHFTNLRYLKCSPSWSSIDISISDGYIMKDENDNPVKGLLKELDLSQNTKLCGLYCEGNNLTTLDVSTLTALSRLHCYANNLSSLDVSGLKALTGLNCSGNNLESLDARGLTELAYLSCESNKLSSLDVCGLAELDELRCNYNNLSALDISSLTSLTKLYCYNNNLSALDVSGLTALTDLECSNNNLTTLKVSGLTTLTGLSCDHNNLTMLDVSGLTALTNLECSNNNLTTLKVSGLTTLTGLSCDHNNLSMLDVSGLTALTGLSCDHNNLSMLDVSSLTALTGLSCGFNNLTVLDVSNLTALAYLYCSVNNLTALDVSNLTVLNDLFCESNNLASLEVSGLTELNDLWCSRNDLTALDLSGLTELTSLGCGNNDLTTLDVRGLTELTTLECWSNRLTSLDVSKLTSLTDLRCQINNLTSLDVSNLTALTHLYCNSNNLTTLDISNNIQLSTLWCQGNPSLTEIWLKTGQQIRDFFYDTDTATLHYK